MSGNASAENGGSFSSRAGHDYPRLSHLDDRRAWTFRLRVIGSRRPLDLFELHDAVKSGAPHAAVEVAIGYEPEPLPRWHERLVDRLERLFERLRELSGIHVAYLRLLLPPDVVLSVLVSGGGIAAIRSLIIEWLRQRNRPVDISIEYPDGRKITIKGELTEAERANAVREALRHAEETAIEAHGGPRPQSVVTRVWSRLADHRPRKRDHGE